MDHISALEDQLARPVEEAARTDLAIRHKHGVVRLLANREDLRGVYAFVDVLEESVRWSA